MASKGIILLMGVSLHLTGCFAKTSPQQELVTKKEDQNSDLELKAGQYVFRIFGTKAPYLALYRPDNGALAFIYKVVISSKGQDFWDEIREDARVTRESRYFASSSTVIPGSFSRGAVGEPGGGSFRADIFRGDPIKASSIGRNKLIKIAAVVYGSGQPAGSTTTHIFVGANDDRHAVPISEIGDVVSFSFVEGLTKAQLNQPWLNVRLNKDSNLPATTRMGCSSNYNGEIVSSAQYEGSDISGVCEKEGRAGPL